MSDGPHKSLPMPRGWKHVAERCDTAAFTASEVASSIVPALHEDCKVELSESFLDGFRELYGGTSLFERQLDFDLESLRSRVVRTSLEHAIVDNALHLAAAGNVAADAAVEAVCRALGDRSARSARQVEEHYLRKSNQPRAVNVRNRLEQGIGLAGPQIRQLAQQMMSQHSGGAASRLDRQQGLDDGVALQ